MPPRRVNSPGFNVNDNPIYNPGDDDEDFAANSPARVRGIGDEARARGGRQAAAAYVPGPGKDLRLLLARRDFDGDEYDDIEIIDANLRVEEAPQENNQPVRRLRTRYNYTRRGQSGHAAYSRGGRVGSGGLYTRLERNARPIRAGFARRGRVAQSPPPSPESNHEEEDYRPHGRIDDIPPEASHRYATRRAVAAGQSELVPEWATDINGPYHNRRRWMAGRGRGAQVATANQVRDGNTPAPQFRGNPRRRSRAVVRDLARDFRGRAARATGGDNLNMEYVDRMLDSDDVLEGFDGVDFGEGLSLIPDDIPLFLGNDLSRDMKILPLAMAQSPAMPSRSPPAFNAGGEHPAFGSGIQAEENLNENPDDLGEEDALQEELRTRVGDDYRRYDETLPDDLPGDAYEQPYSPENFHGIDVSPIRQPRIVIREPGDRSVSVASPASDGTPLRRTPGGGPSGASPGALSPPHSRQYSGEADNDPATQHPSPELRSLLDMVRNDIYNRPDVPGESMLPGEHDPLLEPMASDILIRTRLNFQNKLLEYTSGLSHTSNPVEAGDRLVRIRYDNMSRPGYLNISAKLYVSMGNQGTQNQHWAYFGGSTQTIRTAGAEA